MTGLYQRMTEAQNNITYNMNLSAEQVRETFQSLFNGPQRHVRVQTGAAGMETFQQAMQNSMNPTEATEWAEAEIALMWGRQDNDPRMAEYREYLAQTTGRTPVIKSQGLDTKEVESGEDAVNHMLNG